jgi:Mg-chelatase subunit ChlD
MSLLRPWIVWGIPIALAFALAIEWISWRNTKRLFNISRDAVMLARLRRGRAVALVLFAGVVIFTALALAGPYRAGSVEKRGLRAIVVLDVSWSMSAADYPQPISTRFEAAKRALHQLFQRFPEGQVGLVVFAGKALQWVPAMQDFGAFEWILENWVKLGVAPAQGSEIAEGLAQALILLTAEVDDPNADPREYWRDPQTGKVNYWRNPTTGKADAVVILLSDGGDKEIPSEILDAYVREGIRIVAVGLGRPAETSITLRSVSGETKTYSTRLNEGVLREISRITGGEYVHVVSSRELAEVFARHPDYLRPSLVPEAVIELYQWPASIALLFAVLWVLSVMRR